MPPQTYRRLRRRSFDRLRQKLWAVPAWFWLCVLRRGGSRATRRRTSIR
jgi:hypothetical protein